MIKNSRLSSMIGCLALLVCSSYILASDPQWSVPITEHGHPDLQGTWYFGTNTPFSRPAELGDKRAYSEEEALAVEAEMRASNLAQDAPLDPDRPAPERGGQIGFQADFNFALKRSALTRVHGEYRTSLIIDPPNGQMPRREGFKDFHDKRRERGITTYSGPEAQSAGERCLVGGLAVPSMYPPPWNANMQIVQNKDYVMMMSEMNHDARIIKLSGKRSPLDAPSWMGDSIGYWDEQTLVVHTVKFRPEQSSFLMDMSESFEMTEYFTPVSADEILYRYTVTDLEAFTAPFTVERTIRRRAPEERIFEVACHEGNYSMVGVLAGTRYQEQMAAEE